MISYPIYNCIVRSKTLVIVIFYINIEIYNYFVSKFYIDIGFAKSVFHKNVEGIYSTITLH